MCFRMPPSGAGSPGRTLACSCSYRRSRQVRLLSSRPGAVPGYKPIPKLSAWRQCALLQAPNLLHGDEYSSVVLSNGYCLPPSRRKQRESCKPSQNIRLPGLTNFNYVSGTSDKETSPVARFLPALSLAKRLNFWLDRLSRIAFYFCKAKICFLLPRFLLLLFRLAFLVVLSPNFRNLFSFVAARQHLLVQFTLFARTPARSNVIALTQTFAAEMLFDLRPVVDGLVTNCRCSG